MKDESARWVVFFTLVALGALTVLADLRADNAERDIDALQAELTEVRAELVTDRVELDRIETAWCGNGILYAIDDDGDFDRCMEQWRR